MEKENSVFKVLATLGAAILGYSAYKLITNRGSLSDLVDSSPIKNDDIEEAKDRKGFTITFENESYEIAGTDVMMTAHDFIVNVLEKDPKKVGIGEIFDDQPGTVMILHMKEPIDLYAMSMNKGPELALVNFEDVPMAKDADDAVIEKTSTKGISILSKDKKEEKPAKKRDRKAEPRIIMVNEEPVTWTMGKIKGMDIKRLIPETAAEPYNYIVTQIFLRKPKIEIGDTDEITLWRKMKFRFEVKIIGDK